MKISNKTCLATKITTAMVMHVLVAFVLQMLRIVEMKRRVQFLKNGKYHAEMLSRRFTIIWQEK
jgi:hypoxanthine-guanine phosphoribosyltransferase